MAVFAADGACLTANDAYTPTGLAGERRSTFSPDGRREWTLAAAPADGARAAQSRFLAAMGHELRTPLNAVIGFAELMEQEALGPLGSDEYVEYAGHILRSGQALLHMIANLLDYSRLEAGTLVLRSNEVELVRLVRSIVASARAESAKRSPSVTVTFDAPGEIVCVYGDEARLRQALGAVVGHAVAVTPNGGQVTVRLRPAEDGGEIEVIDGSMGLSAAEVAAMFEPYWLHEHAEGHPRGGAGIGLRLARELIALHGGRLRLDSRKGEGTRAVILLPHNRPETDADSE